jgi:hypothetical protein
MEVFAWIEQTTIGVWVREAPTVWAFPFVLILHTVGLALVAGAAVIMNAFALTRPGAWDPGRFEPLFRIAWAGFAINFISGVLLLAAYPAKALTNPVFYVKLACVVGAMVQLQWLRNRVVDSHRVAAASTVSTLPTALQRSAVSAFLLWATAVVTGRFLAYTYRYLMSSDMSIGFG